MPPQPQFPQFSSPKLPSKFLLLKVQNEHPRFPTESLFVDHLKICLKLHSKQAQPPTVSNDTFDLSSFSKNMSVPPNSPFCSLSIESLISSAAETLDHSFAPQASAKPDNQAVCPRQLRSTTSLQRHAQRLHQLEKHLPSNLKTENTSQNKKKHRSHKTKQDTKK